MLNLTLGHPGLKTFKWKYNFSSQNSAEKCAAKDLTSDYDDDLLPPEVDKYKKASQSVKTALRGVEFIAQHIKDADKDNEVKVYFSLKNVF